MNTTEITPGPRYTGTKTETIVASVEAHTRAGYAAESEPYARVLRACTGGGLMPDDTAPFSKLGPVAWICIAVIFALPLGMILGAGAKVCEPAPIVGPR